MLNNCSAKCRTAFFILDFPSLIRISPHHDGEPDGDPEFPIS
jgi:hypothetical protein